MNLTPLAETPAPLTSPAQPPPQPTTPLAASIRCEWRLLSRDPGWWALTFLLLGCIAYAMHNGRALIEGRDRAFSDARRDEVRRLENLTSSLNKIERGLAKTPDAPYRDPGNALYVGRGQGATLAHLPATDLSIIGIGLSDLYPQVVKVSAGSKDTFLFADELANPSLLLSGGFDFAFVVVYIFPLVLLALCYNLLSAEREQGTLGLIASSSAPLRSVLLGKLLVRAGGMTLVALVGFGLCLGLYRSAGQGIGTGSLLALVGVVTVIAAYGAFWAVLALLVNSLGQDSAFNAVALVMAWVLLLLVGPAAIAAMSEAFYPAPPRSEIVLAVREAAIDAERDLDAAEVRYRDEHPTEAGANRGENRSQRNLEVTLAADARADSVLALQDERVRSQRRLGDRLAYLTPPAMINDALAELAGNGHTRWDDYLQRVSAFHKVWQSFFIERARKGVALKVVDYAQFPRFSESDSPTRWKIASGWRVAGSIVWVGMLTAVLGVWANRRLARTV